VERRRRRVGRRSPGSSRRRTCGASAARAARRHTFFLLKGCRDTTAGLGRGFFTETLRSDFHAIRATLEAFNRTATIAGADEAEACGLGMTDQKPWNLALRVTTANSVATYLIDRWD
jgi:hypothetical protein